MAHEEDQASMQAFIRSQMYSIMHPIGEHVRELQAQFQQMGKRLSAVDGRIDETRVCYEQQHDEVLALRRALAQTDTHIEKLVNDLGGHQRDKERLGADHEVTKSDLAKIAGNLRTSNVMTKALQQKCEDLDNDVRSLHTGAEKMGKSIAEEAEKAARTKELADVLNARHLDMSKDVEDLRRSAGETGQAMHKLSRSWEKNHAAVCSEVAQHLDQLGGLERRLGSAQGDLHAHAETIRNVEEKLRLMKLPSESDFGAGGVDSSRASNHGESAQTSLKAHADAMETMKAALTRLQDLFNGWKDEYAQLFKDLDRRVGDNTTHMHSLQSAKESMSEHFRKNDAFLTKLQQSLDMVGGQVDMLQLDFKGMNAAQKDIAGKVETQRIALTKAQADLKHTDAHVDTANESLMHLKEGLSAMDVTISKLGARYDSCSRNLHGVSRGLADVGKHVHQGDHGLLPPKPLSSEAARPLSHLGTDIGGPPPKPLSHQGTDFGGPPPKPLSHQGADFGFLTSRSPDLGRSGLLQGDLSPLPLPASPHTRRFHSLHLRTGTHVDSALSSAR